MEPEEWLKLIKKKVDIAQCTDQERVLFATHQQFGTAADRWETYNNSN
jgi:hypothetical protein